MKAKEMLNRTVAELQEERSSLEKKMLSLRFGSVLKGDKTRPTRVSEVRRDIARINTILREKQPRAGVKNG